MSFLGSNDIQLTIAQDETGALNYTIGFLLFWGLYSVGADFKE